MQFDGTETINKPREAAWRFMTDPHAVSQCVPGLKSLDVIAPDYDEHGILDGLPALPMALGSRVRH